jgi:hypothetical protein
MLGSHPDARSPGSVRDAGPEAGTPDQKPGRRTRSRDAGPEAGTPDQKQRGRVDVPRVMRGARAGADPSWGNKVGPQ